MCDSNKPTQTQTQIFLDSSFPYTQTDENVDDDVWARLLPINSSFSRVDLKNDITTFGRRLDCDVSLNISTSSCAATAYSNIHFKIKREFSTKTGSHFLLEDLSTNGTFINGEKVGKGKVHALKNNSEISLSKKENKVYIFIDLANRDDKIYPLSIKDKYTITKTLGVGSYGEVKLAFEKDTCEKVAIKIISKKKFTVNGKNQMNLNTQILSEINILKRLEHPCIIKIKEVIDTIDTVFIVLELVEGGELFDKVIQLGQYEESTAKLLFYQMVLAIKYLHDQGISHRDLKPENILLCSGDKNETLIKVSDFGLSKFFDSTAMMKTFCGTPDYLAPEVVISKGEGFYTNKIDNWSLGVILYICLVGYPPFSNENTILSLEKQIIQGAYEFPAEFWYNVSDDAIDLVKRLLCVDPVKRASLEEVIEHRWIKNDECMKIKAHELMYGSNSDVKRKLAERTDSDSSSVLITNNKKFKSDLI